MAVRTVTVELKLNATGYLAAGRAVVSVNNDIDDSFNRINLSAAAASLSIDSMSRDLRQLSTRALRAERRVHDLREEIDRLIAAQAALRAGGPIPLVSPGGAGRMGGGMLRAVINAFTSMPAPAQAAIGGAIAGAITITAPMIGSAFGGALLLGLGAGGLGLGIAAAMHDRAVTDAFAEFGRFAASQFESYGDAFEVPLIEAAEHFHDRFASISPEIRSMLQDASRGLMPLAEGLTGFIERAMPGLQAGMRGALDVMDAFGQELPQLGAAVGDFFRSLGDGSEGAADGLVAILDILETMIVLLGVQMNYWEHIFGFLSGLPDWIKSILGPMGALLDGAGDAGSGLEDLKFKVEDTRSAFERLTESLLGLTDGFNSTYGAAIAYEEALDGLSESVKKNGHSMDISTAAGRNNARALMDVFEAARKTYDANIASGMSAQEAARKYNDQIEAARRSAIAAGMAADEVNRLATAQRNLPSQGKTITNRVITQYVTEGTRAPRVAPGTLQFQRDGGVQWARGGLMGLSGNAGVYAGGSPLFGFAEQGTGGEAFIARNAPHGRSLAIANEAAGWHGGMVVPRNRGSSVVVVIPPAPTNANRELVSAVERQISRNIRIESRGDVQRHFGSSGRL